MKADATREPPAHGAAPGGWARLPVFEYGFRPFFLLAGLQAVIAMLAWMAVLWGDGAGLQLGGLATALPGFYWHGHEMLFGFVLAVIAGFLLTAMPNWTGAKPLRRAPLAALVALWLASRAAAWYGATGPWAAVIDLAFPAALIGVVAVTLGRARAWRNMILIPILLLLMIGDGLVHAEALGLAEDTARAGLMLAADTVLLLIVIIGGRIVPAFTGAALARIGGGVAVAAWPRVARAAVLSVALLLVVDIFAPGSQLAGAVAALAALLNGIRLAGWRTSRALGQPILWILHLGYLWVVAALVGRAVADLGGPLGPATALHILTVGAIGSFTIGVMSRAGLGHCGRLLVAGPALATAYVLISLAALARIVGPTVTAGAPGGFIASMMVSGGLWVAGFGLFLAVMAPLLLRRRADGRPG